MSHKERVKRIKEHFDNVSMEEIEEALKEYSINSTESKENIYKNLMTLDKNLKKYM